MVRRRPRHNKKRCGKFFSGEKKVDEQPRALPSDSLLSRIICIRTRKMIFLFLFFFWGKLRVGIANKKEQVSSRVRTDDVIYPRLISCLTVQQSEIWDYISFCLHTQFL